MRDLLQVKSKYLNEVTDVEDKLKLAMDYKMHSIAINVCVCMYAAVCVCTCVYTCVCVCVCVYTYQG